jgi:hypothetical protein
MSSDMTNTVKDGFLDDLEKFAYTACHDMSACVCYD